MTISAKNARSCELKMLTTELLSISLFILFFAALDYLVMWQPQLNHLLQLKQTLQQLKEHVIKKQNQLKIEENTKTLLKQWENKNPDFYQRVTGIKTPNQQFSLLTDLIQNAHFQILTITKNDTFKNATKDCQLSIKTNGQFSDLLSLIDTLTHFVIPFQLTQLSISTHQYNMMFVVRDCHE